MRVTQGEEEVARLGASAYFGTPPPSARVVKKVPSQSKNAA